MREEDRQAAIPFGEEEAGEAQQSPNPDRHQEQGGGILEDLQTRRPRRERPRQGLVRRLPPSFRSHRQSSRIPCKFLSLTLFI